MATMSIDDLEAAAVDLTESAAMIVAGVVGDEGVIDRGYVILQRDGVPSEVRVLVIVNPDYNGLVIGKKGFNALVYRNLLSDRAKVMGFQLATDLRFVDRRSAAGLGVSWLDRD